MESRLADKRCLPCRGGTPPLPRQAVARLLSELSGWALNAEGH
ncbi:hypothetical protein ACFL2T_00810 [Elusimicrobiota bacterium]